MADVETASAPLIEPRQVRGWLGWVILELASDAVIVVNEARRILLVNRSAEIVFGRDRDEMVRFDLEELIPDARGYLEACWRNPGELSTRPDGLLEARARYNDRSEFPIALGFHSMTDIQGTLFVVVARPLLAVSSTPPDEVVGHLIAARGQLDAVLTSVDVVLAEQLLAVAHELELALDGLL